MPQKNEFGQPLWLKKKIFQIIGHLTRKRLVGFNDLKVSGTEVLLELPQDNVLFVSNHETIFTDVIATYHVLFSTLAGQIDSIQKRGYLRNPKLNLYFVAARETMSKGFLLKIFKLAGAVLVDRTWKEGNSLITRKVNPEDTKTIGKAIKSGWVITFPAGTTSKGAPVRKGTAHIIKQYEPIVVPIKIDGFREAFDKSGLKVKKKGVKLSLAFGNPIKIDFERDKVKKIVEKIERHIY